MSTIVYVVIAVGLVTAFIYWRQQTRTRHEVEVQARTQRLTASPPDYQQDREDARVARMSDDDRAWEAASLQRNRDILARETTVDPRP